MIQQATRLNILQAVSKHEDEWGWYQFERGFIPSESTGGMKARDILRLLETEGMICRVAAEPLDRYRLTEKGKAYLTGGLASEVEG